MQVSWWDGLVILARQGATVCAGTEKQASPAALARSSGLTVREKNPTVHFWMEHPGFWHESAGGSCWGDPGTWPTNSLLINSL